MHWLERGVHFVSCSKYKAGHIENPLMAPNQEHYICHVDFTQVYTLTGWVLQYWVFEAVKQTHNFVTKDKSLDRQGVTFCLYTYHCHWNKTGSIPF